MDTLTVEQRAAMAVTEIAQNIMGKRTALSLSGGKDSLTLLDLIRPLLFTEDITVFWMNTGDPIPETEAAVREAIKTVPKFIEVKADVLTWKQANGIPTDLLPSTCEPGGIIYGRSDTLMTTRWVCCFENKLAPFMHAIRAEGIEVLIRGTKRADAGRVPFEGDANGLQVLLPLRDWSQEDVFTYVKMKGIQLSKVYDTFKSETVSGPDCLHCTAVWSDNKAAYLKQLHPEVHAEYIRQLKTIKIHAEHSMMELNKNLETE